jgi:ubiquinone/menaquinone biosynthesis C-methylase UbiE
MSLIFMPVSSDSSVDSTPKSSSDSPLDANQGVSEQYHSLYNDFYTHQDPQWRAIGADQKYENIRRLCTDIPHQTILEVGAGDGAISERLCTRQFCTELHALDISESGIQKLKQKNIPQIQQAQVFDGTHIPYADQSFDLVILSHVVEHLEHPRQLLYEACRVGKAVFIEVPLEDTRALSSEYVPDHVGHINVYSPRTIRRLLQTCELDIQQEYVHVPSLKAHQHSSRLKGILKYTAKRIALSTLPALSTHIFTYHASFLGIPKQSSLHS